MAQRTALIIGAGISGLTTAVYLQRSGVQTLVLEKAAGPGGVSTSWKRKGYTFEGGIHWLIGAKQEKRANRGTVISIVVTLAVTAVIAGVLFFFAGPSVSLFTKDREVIQAGVLFLRLNVFFTLFNCVNHVLAGGIRGRGDSKGPMVIMLLTFVGVRQVYLFVMSHFIRNTPATVGFGYPVGWMACCIIEVIYFYVRYSGRSRSGC